jgi:hypothetical protein
MFNPFETNEPTDKQLWDELGDAVDARRQEIYFMLGQRAHHANKDEQALALFDKSLELCETIAREMPVEQLAGRPAVFVPLIRMRLWEQTRSPVPERDWAKVETLINDLENAKPASPSSRAATHRS